MNIKLGLTIAPSDPTYKVPEHSAINDLEWPNASTSTTWTNRLGFQEPIHSCHCAVCRESLPQKARESIPSYTLDSPLPAMYIGETRHVVNEAIRPSQADLPALDWATCDDSSLPSARPLLEPF